MERATAAAALLDGYVLCTEGDRLCFMDRLTGSRRIQGRTGALLTGSLVVVGQEVLMLAGEGDVLRVPAPL